MTQIVDDVETVELMDQVSAVLQRLETDPELATLAADPATIEVALRRVARIIKAECPLAVSVRAVPPDMLFCRTKSWLDLPVLQRGKVLAVRIFGGEVS